MEKDKVIVTTIDALGLVEAKNDRVSFSLSLKSKDESLDLAENKVKEKTAHFINSLGARKMDVDGDVSISVSNYKLEHREGNEKTPAGYQSISSISWTMIVGDNLDEVYRDCMKADPTMPYPMFSIKDRTTLQEEAYKKAGENVKEKLYRECALLGISPEKLKVYNWNFGHEGFLSANKNFVANAYNGVYGAQGVTGPTGPQGAQAVSGNWMQVGQVVMTKLGSIYQELLTAPKLNPGTVTIRVPIQINYIWAE